MYICIYICVCIYSRFIDYYSTKNNNKKRRVKKTFRSISLLLYIYTYVHRNIYIYIYIRYVYIHMYDHRTLSIYIYIEINFSVKVYLFFTYIYHYICILDICSVDIIPQDPPDRSLMTHRDFIASRERRNAQDSPGWGTHGWYGKTMGKS